MKKFFMKLTAIAVMPMLLAACTKDEVNPTPTNGGKEGEIELILKNESVADGTRAFGSGTTESWEKSISSAVLIVYNTSGTQILRRVLTAAEVNGSTTTPIKFVLPGVSADASCDFYVVINRNIADNITTKTGLLAELESDIASYNSTYANVTTKAMRTGGFVMTGSASVKIAAGTTAVTEPRPKRMVRVSPASRVRWKWWAPTGAQPWAMLPVHAPRSTASGPAGPRYGPRNASRLVSKPSGVRFTPNTA